MIVASRCFAMSGPIERKLAAGFISATLLALILGYGFYQQVKSFLESDRWVEHTHTVLDQIKSINTTVTQAETAQRGFCITGDAYFLQPFQANSKQLPGPDRPARHARRRQPLADAARGGSADRRGWQARCRQRIHRPAPEARCRLAWPAVLQQEGAHCDGGCHQAHRRDDGGGDAVDAGACRPAEHQFPHGPLRVGGAHGLARPVARVRPPAHLPRTARPPPHRERTRRRARRRAGFVTDQERVPGQHEPRNPHADERHHRHVAAC